ncbi:MAG: hypothetical protein MJZ61_04020, partial [Bacteroidales bacterium]|nr:hypothetical protein [Bacteroidales bacterium]
MKYRSIQLGVIAIATLCIIILLMAMFYYYKVQQNQNNTLNEIGWEQRKQIIETVISIKKEQSESVLHENSAWTELIEYINDPTDEDWIYENIGTMSESYDNAVNVVVFNKKGTLVYENPVEGYEDIEFFRDIKIPTLFRNDYKINFVLYQGDKVFEYFGSTVVSSEDIVTRQEEASGYLFLIREINDTLLNEYNNALGCLETAVTHNGRQLEERQKENKDNYFYSIELKNHFGNTIAYMYFVSGNPIQNILKSFLPMLLFMFGVVLAMFIALLIYTRARITKPLQQIAKIFEKEDYKKIEYLTDNPTEFGVLSKAIIAFFKQKHGMESLNKELESKQEELQQQNGILQKQKDEIESQIENIKVLNQQIMERNKDTERKNVQISVKNQQLVEQSENIKGLQGRIEDLEYTIKFNQKQLEMANAHLLDNQNYASRLRNVLQVALTPTKHVFTDFFLHTKP